MPTPYTDSVPHAGSAEVLATGMFDELAGTIARTLPRSSVTSNTVGCLTTAGVVGFKSIVLPAGLVVTNIQLIFGGTAASGPTHFWIGLTDAQSNVLAVSADQGSAAQNNATPIKLPMTIPYVIQQTGLYYVAVSSTATTTAPTLTGNTPAGGTPGQAPTWCGTGAAQSTPPAIGANLGAITAGTSAAFAAWIS